MPVYAARQALFDGIGSVPYLWPLLKLLPWLGLLYVVKQFFSGGRNSSERNMHGKVVLVTGGTSGVGAAVVRGLATRGAQIVLLTPHELGDVFLVEYIDGLRHDTGNRLLTAETVDLASLHSIRQFATKWIDNAPARRLDMLVLCASTLTPGGGAAQSTREGIELNWQINYLANFHLLSILSPALRAQPPDRDVRILFGTCSSYLGGDLLHITQPHRPSRAPAPAPTHFSPANAYATSKLALTTFALAFQKHLAAYKRPDGDSTFPRVLLVDPGLCRTPGTRRWLTWGSLLGLAAYLALYPVWWLVLKSPDAGAQSFLYAAMEERFGREAGGVLVKEVRDRRFLREDVRDEEAQGRLWAFSEGMVQEAEKRGAVERARARREAEEMREEEDAVREMQDYRQKVGKKGGREEREERSRRSKKAS